MSRTRTRCAFFLIASLWSIPVAGCSKKRTVQTFSDSSAAAVASSGAGSKAASGLPTNSPTLPIITIPVAPPIDPSTPTGTYYVVANGFRIELSLNGASSYFRDERGGSWSLLTNFSWDPVGRWVEFRRDFPGGFQWYRLSLVQGVLAGRYSSGPSPNRPPLTAFTYHATGWSPTWIDQGGTFPRTWRATFNGRFAGVIRIDLVNGRYVGRFKIYDDTMIEGVQESLEEDLSEISWDGYYLAFTRTGPGYTQRYSATANGRFLNGTYTHNGSGGYQFSGTRAQVLGFGLGSRIAARNDWQMRTRSRLQNLTEGMRYSELAPPPVTITEEPCVGCPFTAGAYPPHRDDDPNRFPPNYTLRRLKFAVAIGNRFDPAAPPPVREYFGYLATPNTPAPPGGYKVVVAVNGHGGNARLSMTSSDAHFWYGDAAARRGYAVLAVDIGHRPFWQDRGVQHAPVVGAGYSNSDWEEDGERNFSVRRAIDYLVGGSHVTYWTPRPNINPNYISIQGLSMGGEISTITAAMDTRLKMAVSAGYSPDAMVVDVYRSHSENHPRSCYIWGNADLNEYMDTSDYEALIAPRGLVVQTGIQDLNFSNTQTPYAADKQVLRRARAAYGPDATKLVHYLHYDEHHFHVGEYNPSLRYATGLLDTRVNEPAYQGDLHWQTNTATNWRSGSLYTLMNEWMP